MQHAISCQTALGTFGPVADGSENGFNRVAGADAVMGVSSLLRPSSVPPFLDLYGLELLFRITGWNFPKLGAHVFKWASWFTGINVITQHDDQV